MIGYEVMNEKKQANRARFLRHTMKYAWQFIFTCFILQCLRCFSALFVGWSYMLIVYTMQYFALFFVFASHFSCLRFFCVSSYPYLHFYYMQNEQNRIFICLLFIVFYSVYGTHISSLACSAFTCIHMWKTNNMTPQYFRTFFFFFHLLVSSQFANSFFHRLIFSACVTKSLCVCEYVSVRLFLIWMARKYSWWNIVF